MFIRILKKDLKRKKTMNAILLLFIIMASMFLASSVSNLKIVLGAVDEFLEISKVPDFFTLAVNSGGEDQIAEYLRKSDEVEEFQITNMFGLSNENIRFKKREAKGEKKQYNRMSSLAICPVPEDFMKIFDQDGQPVELVKGELAIPRVEAENNHLAVGDVLEIQVEEVTKTFEIKTIVKDAVFGNSMLGFKRFYVSKEEFQDFEDQENYYYTNVYSVNTKDMDAFMSEFKKQNFNVLSNIDRQLVKMCYFFDMLVSAILIIVSVCLILIAFLILRFTIVFTLQEDYKEIGIMKAIGIQNRGIRGLYLVKYLAISVMGSLLGLVFSFPFGRFLMNQVVVNIVVEQKGQEPVINILCAICIVAVVLLFCNLSAGRLKRFTAMEAIRNGSCGERFHKKNVLKLSKRRRMRAPVYMACNDILSNKKRFVALGFIFCIGTLLILLPLSAINTLKSKEIVKSFSILPSTAYVDNGRLESYMALKDDDALKSDMKDMERILEEHGLKCKVWAEAGYIVPCYSKDPQEVYNYLTLQGVGHESVDYQVVEGCCPELENEVMLTELTAKEMEVGIGDSIYYQYGKETKEYIITGLYQSMINVGKGFRMNPQERMDYQYLSGVLTIQVDVLGDGNEIDAWNEIAGIFSEYKVQDASGFINDMTGGVQTQIDSVQALIVGVVLIINCLITVLMVKTMIAREHGEIAMLKSIGFPNAAIQIWQTCRILIILICSIAAGILLSIPLRGIIIKPIFVMMGATSMELVINPLENYVFYPMMMLIITGLSAMLCGGEIKKVDLKEINSLE